MGCAALSADLHAQARENKRARFGSSQKNAPKVVRLPSLERELVKVPGMNGFGVEGPRGLKQKKLGEALREEKGPEQGRRYKDPNWWNFERMMM